jgi:Tol biopolymer transport system component
MTDQELEQRLRDWYRSEIPTDEAAPAALRSMLGAIPRESTVLRPRFGSRRGVTLLAAAALVGLLAGTAVVGGFLPPRPDMALLLPSQLPSEFPSELPSVRPSDAPEAGWIVYTRWRTIQKGQEDCTGPAHTCHRSSIFISNQDGSDERLLDPGQHSWLIGGSPDGSKLIILKRDADGDHPYLTEADGSQPQRLDTGCRPPCVGDWLGSNFEPGLAFSPDETRLAFVRAFSDDTFGDPRSVIAIMDMATGAVVELDSTAGVAREPSWSPDGAHLVFGQYVIDADGRNLHQVAPTELAAGEGPSSRNARWSPDGSLIVFTSSIDTIAIPGVIDNSQRLSDIYTVRPDGTGLQRLTTDTVGPLGTTEPGDFGARNPSWTRDGRIVFIRDPAAGETVMQLWVMDRDGSNATRLDPSDAASLTAIGCISCPYPATDLGDWPGLPTIAFWMPAR